MKKKIIVIGVILLLIVGIVMTNINRERSKEIEYDVTLESVTFTENLCNELEFNGKIILNSLNKQIVSSEYAGRVEEMFVQDGAEVQENDVIFTYKRYSDDTLIEIKAEKSGYISFNKDLAVGSSIGQYDNIAHIYKLNSAEDFFISCNVPEYDYKYVDYAEDIQLIIEGGTENYIFKVETTNIIPEIKTINGIDNYIIKLQLSNMDEDISKCSLTVNKPVTVHMNYKINIENENLNYYTIPRSALVIRDGKDALFEAVKRSEEFYSKLRYVTIISEKDESAIISVEGYPFEKNSLIVTTGNYQLSGDEKIKPNMEGGYLDLNLFD